MFCWPSRRGSSSRKKSKSELSSYSSGGDDDSIVTGGAGIVGSKGGGILVKPYKGRKKGKKSSSATFKCDLSEALLPPSDECLISLRSASCNSSIRDLNGFHRQNSSGGVRGSNRHHHFVSSHNIPHHFPEEDGDCDSVNNNNNSNCNNNRSAEVLLFYSNNSLSTRNSVVDFIENEEFNYKSLWGKDINEWDSRESRCNTLDRERKANYIKTSGGSNSSSTNKTALTNSPSGVKNGTTSPPKDHRLSPAKSSPSLTIHTNQNKAESQQRDCKQDKKFFDDEDDESLPSPPPTPPEAKVSLSTNSNSGSFFKYPPSESVQEKLEDRQQSSSPSFRVHSSTSTSSLSSSCILTPEIVDRSITEERKSVSDCATQTLPFWQLEFPGVLHCSCNINIGSGEENGILLNESSIAIRQHHRLLEDSPSSSSTSDHHPAPLSPPRGHESPGADSSSSGISSSDDNLESLHAEEEIMLKSLKNSFLHQAIPFQLCNFSIGGNSNANSNNGSTNNKETSVSRCKESGTNKSNHGHGACCSANVITTITNANNFNSNNNFITSQECQAIINGLAGNVTNSNTKSEKLLKVHEQNYKNKNKKEKCERLATSTEHIASVANQEDRNRLGPVGKNYGSAALDANANEPDGPLLRPHGQSNGELEPSTKSSRTKVPGSAEPLNDSPHNTTVVPSNNHNTSSNLIITKTKSSTNNRVSSTNQQNIQNSVLVQENSSLKEEVSRLTSVVSDLQQQISRLTASREESKKTLEECLKKADTSIAALSIVAQQCDKEKQGVYEQLLQQQAENKVWKEHLDEKLEELQKLQDEYEKEREKHQADVRALTAKHDDEVDVIVRNCENKLEQIQKRHDETLAELKRSHSEELERLQESQRQELEQTIQKHRELLDQHRNQSPHDILHKEVESLQVVVEMRNEEIRVLRKDLMDYKNTLNDLQAAREHGKSLVAKIEDLEAQLEKARSDKRSLQERFQVLEGNIQQIESENNRLVRCNEELNWKMKSYNLVEN